MTSTSSFNSTMFRSDVKRLQLFQSQFMQNDMNQWPEVFLWGYRQEEDAPAGSACSSVGDGFDGYLVTKSIDALEAGQARLELEDYTEQLQKQWDFYHSFDSEDLCTEGKRLRLRFGRGLIRRSAVAVRLDPEHYEIRHLHITRGKLSFSEPDYVVSVREFEELK